MRFEHTITSSPLCAPARACLASGRNFWRCGVNDNHDDTPLDGPFFYQNLRAAGYEVCAVGKVDLHKGTAEWKTDGSSWLDQWGFTRGIDNEGKHAGVVTGAEEPAGPYMAMLHREGWADAHVKDLKEPPLLSGHPADAAARGPLFGQLDRRQLPPRPGPSGGWQALVHADQLHGSARTKRRYPEHVGFGPGAPVSRGR